MPIRPVPKDEEKKPEAPFIDGFFVCDPKNKKRDLIAYDFITNATNYKRNIELPIKEWHKGWLFKMLTHKGMVKIFKYAVEIKVNHYLGTIIYISLWNISQSTIGFGIFDPGKFFLVSEGIRSGGI